MPVDPISFGDPLHLTGQREVDFTVGTERLKVSAESSSKLSRFFYYSASVLTFGLVPLIRSGLHNLASKIIVPATWVSSAEDRKRVNDSRALFLTEFPRTSHNFLLETFDHAKIDGMCIFSSEEAKREFFSNKEIKQKWIVRFNGNGEYYEDNLSDARELGQATGANVLLFNYRGVINSQGKVTSPEDLIRDGEACIRYLMSKGIKEEDILIYGHSLGGGVGTQVAQLYPDTGIINQKSFGRLSDVIRNIAGNLAAKLFVGLGWEFNSVEAWQNKALERKFLVLHKHDHVVPYTTSLYKALKERIKQESPGLVAQTEQQKKDVNGQITIIRKERLIPESKPPRLKLNQLHTYIEEKENSRYQYLNNLYIHEKNEDFINEVRLKMLNEIVLDQFTEFNKTLSILQRRSGFLFGKRNDAYQKLKKELHNKDFSEACSQVKEFLDKNYKKVLDEMPPSRIPSIQERQVALKKSINSLDQLLNSIESVRNVKDLAKWIKRIETLEPHNQPLYYYGGILADEHAQGIIDFANQFFALPRSSP